MRWEESRDLKVGGVTVVVVLVVLNMYLCVRHLQCSGIARVYMYP